MVSILGTGRTMAGDIIAFDIQWDGDLAAAGSVLWAMEVTSQDGRDTMTLGYQRSGDVATQFVDDRGSGRRAEVPEDADLGAGEILVRFPSSVVGVAVEWPVWKAVIAVDGVPVATEVVTAG